MPADLTTSVGLASNALGVEQQRSRCDVCRDAPRKNRETQKAQKTQKDAENSNCLCSFCVLLRLLRVSASPCC
jgi:hypothetical protein